MIFGALGVLSDVTVAQAVAVEELAAADPGADARQLFGRAMTGGRAHVAATVNTLILALLERNCAAVRDWDALAATRDRTTARPELTDQEAK